MDEIVLHGHSAVQLPGDFDVTNALGLVRMTIEQLPERLRLTREAQVTALRISPDQRAEVMELRTALRRANQSAVVLSAPESAQGSQIGSTPRMSRLLESVGHLDQLVIAERSADEGQPQR